VKRTRRRVADEAPALPALGHTLEFMRLIWAIDHGLQTTSKRMAASIGVTGRQRLVIRIVGRFPGISAGKLASTLHVHPSTLTGVLKRLEREGLINRRSDPRDARRTALGLAPQGRRLDMATAGTVESAVEHVLAHLAPGRIREAQVVLRILAERLGVQRGRGN
jgi:MarR family transcriptional regulator, organic hydroperoxide resistance regulator